MTRFIRKHGLIILFSTTILLIHLLLINPAYQLHRDEYLYLAQGRRLAWGYLAVPPTIGFLGFICNILGGSVFLVRLFPALFGALTVYMTGKIVMEMKGGLFAQFLACLAYLASGYLRMNHLFQPNSMDVLYFTIGVYFVVRYIRTSNSHYLLYTGVFVGLALLNKYTIVLFVIGALVGMLATPHRKLFKERNLYMGLLIAVIIFLPNLLWQVMHHFPFLQQYSTLRGNQLLHLSPLTFIKGQLVNCLPAIWVWAAGVVFYLFSKAIRPWRLLGWIYVTTLVVLLLTNGKDYYAMGAYPMLMAGGGVFLESLTRKALLRRTLRPAMTLVICLLAIPMFIIPSRFIRRHEKQSFAKNTNRWAYCAGKMVKITIYRRILPTCWAGKK